VVDGDGGLVLRVPEVEVELVELRGDEEALVDDGPAGEGGDVEVLDPRLGDRVLDLGTAEVEDLLVVLGLDDRVLGAADEDLLSGQVWRALSPRTFIRTGTLRQPKTKSFRFLSVSSTTLRQKACS
jgi:hypothetical protein